MKLFGNQFLRVLRMVYILGGRRKNADMALREALCYAENNLLTQGETLEGAILQETGRAGNQSGDLVKRSENTVCIIRLIKHQSCQQLWRRASALTQGTS